MRTPTHFKEDAEEPRRVQPWATKVVKGLQGITHRERVREIGLFSLAKRRPGTI